ncbi:MAG TPA: hypothetical protein VM658_10800 [bacterium]|nr:hypothetical protein [bacterium]
MGEQGDIFQALGVLEQKVGGLYMWFGDLFREDEEASALFSGLGRNALAHLDIIRNEVLPAIGAPTRAGKTAAEPEPITNAIAAVDGISRSAPPSLTDALRIASILEIDISEYFSRLAADDDPAIKARILGLAQAGARNTARLESLLTNRGILPPSPQTGRPPTQQHARKKPALNPAG